ncbi:MAG: glycosyltransferase family 2 protein [Nitrospirae bacterium]|nr:glycosyltransferase family 2 protein [Nitrospirota bacterium]
MPLVSIMMPVFNAQLFIEQALESLLKQDYNNIEIVILDNLSTDETPRICRLYMEQDQRVRYICDVTPATSHEAANRLVNYIHGEFCMIACDDDLWEPCYISRLVGFLLEHKEVGLCYSRRGEVDEQGIRTLSGQPRYLLTQLNSTFKNFRLYLRQRTVVPMIFGVFRTSIYRDALPFELFDQTFYNVDNLFMLRILASSKVHGISDILFFYRQKDRKKGKEGSTDKKMRSPVPSNPYKRFLYHVKHQIVFAEKIFSVIKTSRFTNRQRLLLFSYTGLICLFYLIMLLPGMTRLYSGLRRYVKKFHSP